MNLQELMGYVEESKALALIEVVKDIGDYLEFKSMIELGLTVDHKELDFDKVMIFSWIKEGLESGRKH